MVYVRIELWPGGDRTRACLLQEATVTNDGTGTNDEGHYDVVLSHSTTYRGDGLTPDPRAPEPRAVWRRGRVTNWSRNSAPAALVLAALRAALRAAEPATAPSAEVVVRVPIRRPTSRT